MTKNEFMELNPEQKNTVVLEWLSGKPKEDSSEVSRKALHIYATHGCSVLAALYVAYIEEMDE